ncbi:hypothetical protein HK098_003229 [Nowakowskiella sp. JEL0407]|nr:hypothetical protein HK098_003229 [Nowakowskiella sp. JEL0407]
MNQQQSPTFSQKLKYRIQYFLAVTDRPPWIIIRQALWIILSGWYLFLHYLSGALGLLVTIVFIPFAWFMVKIAIFALLPIGKEIKVKPPEEQTGWTDNPMHPYTAIANIVWLFFFGWNLCLAHLTLAMVQALTIIGLGNAIIHVRLAAFILWPFGSYIGDKAPTPFPDPLYIAYDVERVETMNG